MSAARHAASFRDPDGFVYTRDGILHRQVQPSYAAHYEHLLTSGLYRSLVSDDLLVAHEEVSTELALAPGAHRVLRPRPLPFISHPYEWCFGALRDAALLTLEVQRRALDHGMTLKDASAYNVQLDGGRPVFIDTLSFERWTVGEPWVPYRQFCQHFLAPLALMARVDIRLGTLLREHLGGIPLDLASRLLPRRTWWRPGTLLHVHLHARSIRKWEDADESGAAMRRARPLSRHGMLALIDSLRSTIEGLRWTPAGTEWAEYATSHSYSTDALEAKRRFVARAIARTAPSTVWDLGANTGTFSRIAAATGASVISFDVDPAVVERNYRQLRAEGLTRILPLVVDLTNPGGGTGWAARERAAFADRGPADALLALALVHHLAITHDVPFAAIAEWFASLGRTLVIEFVPKSDAMVRRLLASREDLFADYHQQGFEQSFAPRWQTISREPIPGSERVLYLMHRRD